MAKEQAPAFKTPALGIAAGLVIGLAIVAGLLLSGFGKTTIDPSNLATPTAAGNFAKAWQAMYQSTWLQTKKYTRTSAGMVQPSTTGVEARRPPESVSIASANITIIRDNQRTVCTLSVQGAKGTCQASTPIDANALAAQEVTATENLTSGTQALYSVSQRKDNCFYLELTTLGLSKGVLQQPWGTRSSFCFDNKTHALLAAKVERGDTTDAVESQYLVGQVTDNDLDRLSRGDTSFLPQ